MSHGLTGRSCRQFWMWTTLLIASTAAGEEPARDAERIAQLIRDLASTSYSTRERASEELTKIGLAAQPELEAAAVGTDTEARFRAKRILVVVRNAALERQIEAFRNDVDGKQQLTLPGWEAFRDKFGGDKPTRDLFVDMHKSGPAILAAIGDGDARRIAERLREGVRDFQLRMQNGTAQRTPPSAGQTAALLWAACRPDVAVDDQTAMMLTQFVYQSTFQQAVRTAKSVQRQLLSEWVQRDTGTNSNYNKMMLSMNFDLPATIDVARRMIKPGSPGHYRAYGILLVAKYGNASDLETLEPMLTDETVCLTQQAANKKKIEVQVRDVSLAAVVELAGQDLKKFGFTNPQAGAKRGINPVGNSFEDGAKRDVALKAWNEWRAANPAKKPEATKPPQAGDEPAAASGAKKS